MKRGIKRYVKVAISLPEDLLKAVDRDRQARGSTRSHYFRTAVEVQLREGGARTAVDAYVRGYKEHPETAEEVEAARQSALSILAGEPWA